MSVLIEIVPGAVDLLPAAAHIAVCLVHVVGVSVAVIEPSGQHLALMEIVVFIFDELPTGQQFSIFVEMQEKLNERMLRDEELERMRR